LSEQVFFAYARHALVEALRMANVGEGDTVLVPNLICRDVYAAMDYVGAATVTYPITTSLTIDPQFQFPPARAIIVVNYFGFPADLDSLNASSLSKDTIIIEDNAHGWLSRDSSGRVLGERTPLGITSFRKTIRTPDGAFLSWNLDSRIDVRLAPTQPAPRSQGTPWTYRLRKAVMTAETRVRLPLLSIAQRAARLVRRVRGRSPIDDNPQDELLLPKTRAPHTHSLEVFNSINQTSEIGRRRTAFLRCLDLSVKHRVSAIHMNLDFGVCPQGFPFWSGTGDELAFSHEVREHALGTIVTWPSLADRAHIPKDSELRKIKIVNFLQ